MREQYKPLSNFEILDKLKEISDSEENIATRRYVNSVLSACYARGLFSPGSPFKEKVLECSKRYGYEPSRYF